MLIFDHAHPKTIEITLNFPEFALACKNPVQSIDLFWDTVSFRVLRTEWPQPFLTMPTQIFFWSTFNSCEFVWTRKKSGYFTDLFWRYGWLKNPAIWLPENILARLSGTKLFPNMGFAQEYYQYYKFSLSKILGWSTLSSTFKNSTRWKSYKDGFFWLHEIWLFWFNDFILFLCLFRIFKLRILVARPK